MAIIKKRPVGVNQELQDAYERLPVKDAVAPSKLQDFSGELANLKLSEKARSDEEERAYAEWKKDALAEHGADVLSEIRNKNGVAAGNKAYDELGAFESKVNNELGLSEAEIRNKALKKAIQSVSVSVGDAVITGRKSGA